MVDTMSAGRSGTTSVPLMPLQDRGHPTSRLPAPLTSFVGREAEVERVCALLLHGERRLATLTGPGGVGKTRLALRVAEALTPVLADGVAFVDLSPIRDPALVLTAIARALRIPEEGDRPLGEQVAVSLGEHDLLLVLDNVEQVAAAAPEIGRLIAACPGLKVLATSRAGLRITAEQEFPVSPLALPNPVRLPPLAAVEANEAVALFVQRSRAVRPGFVMTETNAAHITAICALLDGLPLAIELAAARSKVLSPPALLARLSNRLQVLTGGPRDLPARQRTMREACAWSYELLTLQEQALFRRLSVFAGGFDLDAAEAVSRGGERSGSQERNDARGLSTPRPRDASVDILEGLSSLVDKSLLRQQEQTGGEARLGMLETLREFGLERLAEAGEEEAARDVHLAHFLALANRAEPELTGPQQVVWLNRLEREHHNLLGALDWALQRGRLEEGLCLAGALLRYWEHHSHHAQVRRGLEQALARSAGLPADVRAKALHAEGVLAFLQGDHVRARDALGESVALYRQAGSDYGAAFALNRLGTLALHAGDHERAEACFGEAEDLIRAVGDQDGVAAVLGQRGYAALLQGDPDRAVARLQESLVLYRELDSKLGSGRVLIHLGRALAERGEEGQALPLLRDALDLVQKAGNRWYLAEGLEAMATVAALVGDDERSARLWGAAEALRDVIGAPIPPGDRTRYQQGLVTLKSRLGEAAFAVAWTSGGSLSPDEAVTEAMAVSEVAPLPTALREDAPVALGDLTPREVEVLRLLADGRTNAEIATTLFISPRTASTHVTNIFNKLSLPSRSAAAAFAHRHGVV